MSVNLLSGAKNVDEINSDVLEKCCKGPVSMYRILLIFMKIILWHN